MSDDKFYAKAICGLYPFAAFDTGSGAAELPDKHLLLVRGSSGET